MLRLRRLLPTSLLLLALLALLTWVLVDRAVSGIAPYSTVRDALARRSDLLSAPLRWLRPGPARLDTSAFAAWRPPPLDALPAPPEHPVRDVEGLRRAMAEVRAGEAVELAAGEYLLDAPLQTHAEGWQGGAIRLRGQPGARLVLRQGGAALQVRHGWWVVEGLQFEGRCEPKLRCEAAVQVQDGASHTRLHALQVSQFSTAVRVLGGRAPWADRGEVSASLFRLSGPFPSHVAGQVLDLQGGSHWRVHGNRVFGIGQPGNRTVAYAVLAKGGGEALQVERNLFVCAPDAAAFKGAGSQVAVGFGGSRTPARWQRNPEEGYEHQHARVEHNVVANCSDVAIDVHRSRDVQIRHNTLLASSGVELRGGGSEAGLHANLTSGAWYPERGTFFSGGYNLRWAPRSAELSEALREARALPPMSGASVPQGADSRWLLP